MHMNGWVAGDSDTMVVRRAVKDDLRIAVELVDHDKMLSIMVMQTGELCLAYTNIRGAGAVRELAIIGRIEITDDNEAEFYLLDSPTIIKPDNPTVAFTHLQSVQDLEDDDAD